MRNRKVLVFDSLDERVCLSCIVNIPLAAADVSTSDGGDDEPETDPGDLPIDDTPIVLPPIPPSGPVGPG